jgi:hypothetical protein
VNLIEVTTGPAGGCESSQWIVSLSFINRSFIAVC